MSQVDNSAPSGPSPSPGDAAVTSDSLGWTLRAREVALRLGGLALAILIIVIIFTLLSKPDTFLSLRNALGMTRAMSTIAIVALGLLLVIVVGEIDLSFGFMYGLAGSLMAVAWIVWGWPIWAAILVAFAGAAFWGAFNAFFVTILKIPSFIVTLGSGQLMFGFTLLVTNTNTYNPSYPPRGTSVDPDELAMFLGLSRQNLPENFPMQGLWMIGVAIVIGLLLSRTLFGFRLKAIGGNPVAAKLARIPVVRYKFAAFIICASLASLAALLDFSFIGSTQPNAGASLLFPVFAAVIIGGASLSGGRGTALGTLMGALLLAVIANGLALLAVGAFVANFVSGTVTIAAVVLDRLGQTLRR